MKISKNSWHYRFNKFLAGDGNYSRWHGETKTLCGYFWKTVLKISLLPFMAALVYTLSFKLGKLFWLEVLYGFTNEQMKAYTLSGWELVWVPAFGLLIIAVALTIIIAVPSYIGYRRDIHREKKRLRRSLNNEPEPKPNIAVEYIKAKKRKICPLLDYN